PPCGCDVDLRLDGWSQLSACVDRKADSGRGLPNQSGVTDAELWAKFRGIEYGCQYAEAFVRIVTVLKIPAKNITVICDPGSAGGLGAGECFEPGRQARRRYKPISRFRSAVVRHRSRNPNWPVSFTSRAASISPVMAAR